MNASLLHKKAIPLVNYLFDFVTFMDQRFGSDLLSIESDKDNNSNKKRNFEDLENENDEADEKEEDDDDDDDEIVEEEILIDDNSRRFFFHGRKDASQKLLYILRLFSNFSKPQKLPRSKELKKVMRKTANCVG